MKSNGTELELNDLTHRISYQSGREGLVLTLNPNQQFSIFTSLLLGSSSRSYSFTSAAIRIPVHTATKGDRDLSDMGWSICKTDAAQLRSVKVTAPKSPFSCDNRSPTGYERRADVVGEHRVNVNFLTSVHFLQISESRQQAGFLDKGPMEFFPGGCRGWRWHHDEPNKLL